MIFIFVKKIFLAQFSEFMQSENEKWNLNIKL